MSKLAAFRPPDYNRAMADSLPQRRWFRFSLRTIFILLAIIAGWVAYDARWIRQRHRFLAPQNALASGYSIYATNGDTRAPRALSLWGEQGSSMVVVCVVTDRLGAIPKDWNTNAVMMEARRLFPEATVKPGMVTRQELEALGSRP